MTGTLRPWPSAAVAVAAQPGPWLEDTAPQPAR